MLIARRPESYEEAVAEIKAAGGTAVGVSADASDAASLDAAFERIKTEVYPGHKLAVAVYNAAGGFMRKPFLETSVEELAGSLDGSVFVFPVPRPPSPPFFVWSSPFPSLYLLRPHLSASDSQNYNNNSKGFFNFAQKTLPLLLETVETSPPHPPTLLVTGATASVRGSANFSTFAAAMFGRRGLAQSLAREFGPKGVHVAHAVIDGVIDIPRTKAYANVNGGVEDGKIRADAVGVFSFLLVFLKAFAVFSFHSEALVVRYSWFLLYKRGDGGFLESRELLWIVYAVLISMC